MGGAERGFTIFKIDLDRVFRDGDGPEEAAREGVNAGVEVVNLFSTNCGLKHIQSDKPERAVLDAAIHCDVRALHESHVRVEDQVI